jgi:hypothetical protein
LRAATIEDGELVAAFQRGAQDGGAEENAAAEDEDVHGRPILGHIDADGHPRPCGGRARRGLSDAPARPRGVQPCQRRNDRVNTLGSAKPRISEIWAKRRVDWCRYFSAKSART